MQTFRCPNCSTSFLAKEAVQLADVSNPRWYRPSHYYVTRCPHCRAPLRFDHVVPVVTVSLVFATAWVFVTPFLFEIPRAVYLSGIFGIAVFAALLAFLFVRPVLIERP